MSTRPDHVDGELAALQLLRKLEDSPDSDAVVRVIGAAASWPRNEQLRFGQVLAEWLNDAVRDADDRLWLDGYERTRRPAIARRDAEFQRFLTRCAASP